MEIITSIKDVLDRVRPVLQQDGGDIEFVEFKDSIVYVRMEGVCVGCSAKNVTLDSIESLFLAEVPGVIGVELTL